MYDDIIQTAFLTAYPRTFTDIPYAKDIFSELEKVEREQQQSVISEDMKVPNLAPEIEARYKLVSLLLERSGITQVFELASGLSTRGITLGERRDITYVELELPDMAKLKQLLIARMDAQRPHLQLIAGNALDYDDVCRAAGEFAQAPVAIINEGLMRYLDFTEKAKLAHNIHTILEQFGGIWITPDVTLTRLLQTQDTVTMPGVNAKLTSATKRNITAHSFDDEAQAIDFFEAQGFNVELHSGSEVSSSLTSPTALAIDSATTAKIIAPVRVMVLRPASQKAMT